MRETGGEGKKILNKVILEKVFGKGRCNGGKQKLSKKILLILLILSKNSVNFGKNSAPHFTPKYFSTPRSTDAA